jgi:hypothetical protein
MKKPQATYQINWKDGTTTKKHKGAVVTVLSRTIQRLYITVK